MPNVMAHPPTGEELDLEDALVSRFEEDEEEGWGADREGWDDEGDLDDDDDWDDEDDDDWDDDDDEEWDEEEGWDEEGGADDGF